MKRILVLVTVMTANVFAVERQQLMPLIEEASTNREATYVEARDKVVAFGTNALPLLAELAIDETISWQQRLAARICYERIERKEDIKKFLSTDWHSHPKIDPSKMLAITGPEGYLAGLAEADMKEIGLWYYCLELEWKMTGEKGNLREYAGYCFWTSACTRAVKDNPEERIWFLRICTDLIVSIPPAPNFSPTRIRWIHIELERAQKPDATYVLEHRAPPPVTEEPPFRLGTKVITPAKQP